MVLINTILAYRPYGKGCIPPGLEGPERSCVLTYQMLEDCAAKDSETYTTALSSKEAQLEKLQKNLERLHRMCAMGDITREEFLSDSAAMQNEIRVLELHIKNLHMTAEQQSAAFSLDFARIRETLDRWIDFSGPTISGAIYLTGDTVCCAVTSWTLMSFFLLLFLRMKLRLTANPSE